LQTVFSVPNPSKTAVRYSIDGYQDKEGTALLRCCGSSGLFLQDINVTMSRDDRAKMLVLRARLVRERAAELLARIKAVGPA
jgi:hypothetical protein